jgi:hypothetical protein
VTERSERRGGAAGMVLLTLAAGQLRSSARGWRSSAAWASVLTSRLSQPPIMTHYCQTATPRNHPFAGRESREIRIAAARA